MFELPAPFQKKHRTQLFLHIMQGSEAVFKEECVGNPCCGISVKDSMAPSLKFEDYKRLCLKWQQAVVAALRIALSSKEYVQTRNALLFLSYNSKVHIYLAGCSLLRSVRQSVCMQHLAPACELHSFGPYCLCSRQSWGRASLRRVS